LQGRARASKHEQPTKAAKQKRRRDPTSSENQNPNPKTGLMNLTAAESLRREAARLRSEKFQGDVTDLFRKSEAELACSEVGIIVTQTSALRQLAAPLGREKEQGQKEMGLGWAGRWRTHLQEWCGGARSGASDAGQRIAASMGWVPRRSAEPHTRACGAWWRVRREVSDLQRRQLKLSSVVFWWRVACSRFGRRFLTRGDGDGEAKWCLSPQSVAPRHHTPRASGVTP